MRRELNEKLRLLTSHQSLIVDFVRSLNDDQLRLRVGNKMGTLGEQFRHVGDIQLCYASALQTGVMDFERQRNNHAVEQSIVGLLSLLREATEEIRGAVEGITDERLLDFTVDWTKTHQKLGRISVVDHIEQLILHQVLHEGELVVYARTLGLKFPDNWRLWGFR